MYSLNGINYGLIDVVGNALLMFKVSIRGNFDSTDSPKFTAVLQILNNYNIMHVVFSD